MKKTDGQIEEFEGSRSYTTDGFQLSEEQQQKNQMILDAAAADKQERLGRYPSYPLRQKARK